MSRIYPILSGEKPLLQQVQNQDPTFAEVRNQCTVSIYAGMLGTVIMCTAIALAVSEVRFLYSLPFALAGISILLCADALYGQAQLGMAKLIAQRDTAQIIPADNCGHHPV
jgi:hypothetical protein